MASLRLLEVNHDCTTIAFQTDQISELNRLHLRIPHKSQPICVLNVDRPVRRPLESRPAVWLKPGCERVTIRNSLAVAMTILLCACQPSGTDGNSSASTDSPELVARYDGHEITVSDVDARILALPRSERPKPGTDLDAWFEQQTREVAMDELLLAESSADKVAEEQEFIGARLDIEARIGVQMCMMALHPDAEQIDSADMSAAYDARQDEFSQPERRSVLYIYKRQGPEKSADATRAEVEALRMRVLGGESFSRLASEHSDSETRHKDGSLGWLTAGDLPTSVGEVVFGLEEGVPSETLVTRDGAHLFYVQKILPARTQSLKEVRRTLRKSLIAERRAKALAELEAASAVPSGSLVLDRKSLGETMNSGDPKAPILQIAGRQISAGGFRTLLAQSATQNRADASVSPGERNWQTYQAIRRRTLVFLHCQSEGHIQADELARKVGEWEEKALLRLVRQRRLLALASADESNMRSFYESNIGQFSTTPTWQLRHLSIPFGPDAAKVMAALEDAAATGGSDVQTLATRFGGATEQWESGDLISLGKRDARLVSLVSPLEVGQLSAPYRTADSLEMVEVMSRQEAIVQPFEKVRVQVAAAYLEQYTGEVYRKLADQMLSTAHFEIVPDGPERLREMGLPQVEVTVEELESMIEQL